MEYDEVSNQDLMEERTLCNKLHQAYRKEEEVWRLKSCSLWLHFRDKNTSFFHKQTKARLQKNIVKEISLKMERD
jgi:hypothetical protein